MIASWNIISKRILKNIYRKYVVDICWDDVVSTRAAMAGKNNTHCVYSYNENYAITRTYKPDGSEYGTGTAPNSGEVGTNKITWNIDSFDIRDPFNPKTVFADTHYSLYLGGEPTAEPREDWRDYYPDNSHTYNTKKFGLENYSIFLLAILIIVLLHHRKKQKK